MVPLRFFSVLYLSASFLLTDQQLVIEPTKLMVEYGAKASANCSTTEQNNGMGWEAPVEGVDMQKNIQFLTWTVDSLTVWDIKPLCYANLKNGQVQEELPVTVYKIPDSLSISMRGHSGPVIEGGTHLLQCDILDVAPVQYLHVTWYKQQFPINSTSFHETNIKPVNKSTELMIQLSRHDDGTTFWCEAKLELGPEGPQPPPVKKSQLLSIPVYYKPVFSNDTEVIEKDNEGLNLNCTASANPLSAYTWATPYEETEHYSGSSIPVSGPGNYTCTASNQYGKAKKVYIIKPKYYNQVTFWTIMVIGLFVLLLIAGYIIQKNRTSGGQSANHSNSVAAQKEEGEELVDK